MADQRGHLPLFFTSSGQFCLEAQMNTFTQISRHVKKLLHESKAGPSDFVEPISAALLASMANP